MLLDVHGRARPYGGFPFPTKLPKSFANAVARAEGAECDDIYGITADFDEVDDAEAEQAADALARVRRVCQ